MKQDLEAGSVLILCAWHAGDDNVTFGVSEDSGACSPNQAGAIV